MRCLGASVQFSTSRKFPIIIIIIRDFSASTVPKSNPSYVDFISFSRCKCWNFSSSLLFSLLYHKNFFKSTIPLILPNFRRFSSKYSKKQHKMANFRRKSSLFGAFSALFDQKARFLCKISRFSAYFFKNFQKFSEISPFTRSF